MKIKIFPAIVCLLLLLCMFPTVSLAADATISAGGTYDISTYFNGGDGLADTLTISTTQPVTLTNTGAVTATNFMIICAVPGVNLTLAGVTINDGMGSDVCPLSFTGGGNVLTLAAGAASTLTGGAYKPAVCVEGSGTELTIDGTGTLIVEGGNGAAGIGVRPGTSSAPVDCGIIRITGGTVNATAGINGGAGIGSGRCGNGGRIVISGDANVTATGKSGSSGTGIGWGTKSTGGSIAISGGTVNAASSQYGPGIGGDPDGGSITISGGNVTATSGMGSAAIGGAQNCGAGTITITGGVVNATSIVGAAIGSGVFGDTEGSVTISGGTVNATSLCMGTGIGSGMGQNAAAVNVTISGTADVTAWGPGGVDFDSSQVGGAADFGGAGIGSGAGGKSCNVTILGGKVTAIGGKGAAGIGGGISSHGGNITISGGTVTAANWGIYIDKDSGLNCAGAGIGGGNGGASGNIAITGGIVYATGTTGAQDIGYGNGYVGSARNLDISGSAAVFLAHDSYLTPVASTHTHKNYAAGTTTVEGMPIPASWTGAFGAFLRYYTLGYNANNGGGAVSPVTQFCNTTAPVSDGSGLTRTYYTFSGWNTAANGSGASYAPGSAFTFTADTTLYAQWLALPVLTSSDKDGIIYTGGRIKLTPNIPGGTWSYDRKYLSRSGNTFKALKKGTSAVTYTVEGQSVGYTVTIVKSKLPPTGQDFTWVYTLSGFSVFLAAAAVASIRHSMKKKR